MQQNWDDIRVFLAVARHETLSAAARSLRIDPATVGRRVTRLEERAGVVLFARSSVGYVLTGSGDQFLRHALSMEGAMADLSRDLQGRDGTLSGQIRIGAPDGCANFVLCHTREEAESYKQKAKEQMPQVQVEIKAIEVTP